jgi:hypothetical protein
VLNSPAMPFWVRQFQLPATAVQRRFDLLLGIAAPVACVIFDPTVFTSTGIAGSGILYHQRLFGYFFVVLGLSSLSYYFVSRRPSAVLSGILFACAGFSFALGIVLLPMTALGILVLVGIFGLVPFVTAFVFFRNASRSWKETITQSPAKNPMPALVAAFLLSLAVPGLLQFAATRSYVRSVATLETGAPQDAPHAIHNLKWLQLATGTDRLVQAYQRSTDSAQRQRLADAFLQITGKTIDERLSELHD